MPPHRALALSLRTGPGRTAASHVGAGHPTPNPTSLCTDGPAMAVVKWSVLKLCLLLHVAAVTWASGGPPRVVGKPYQRHLAKLGKNTKLVCPVEAVPPPLTQWKKDGETIHTGWHRFKVTQDGQLRIRNVHMDDAGLYVCRATNGFGSISVNYSVVVLDEENRLVQEQGDPFPQSPHEDLTKEGMAPVFKDFEKMQREPIVRPMGSTVRLKCRAKGNPEPQVSWFKGDQLLADSRRRPHWIHKLIGVTESDTGSYTCVVSNRLGSLNFTYTLEVIDQIRSKPKLISPHPQNTTVEYGGKTSFQCRVKSIVQPHIKWLKRVEDLEAAQSINTTIEVKGQKFKVLPTTGEVLSDPNGSYLNKLVIKHASADDAGMYICLGANSMGYSFRAAYLHVVPAGQMRPGSDSDLSAIQTSSSESSSSSSSSTSNNLPLFIGVPTGGVIILVILAIFLLQNRRRCNASRAALKRHRLPVPTHDRDAFCNTYHHSPTTTQTGGGTTATSGSNTLHVHTNSLQLSREKMPKTPAPSLDFGSDISSVSHSQPHSQSYNPHLHQHLQQQPMHFMNPHNVTYGY